MNRYPKPKRVGAFCLWFYQMHKCYAVPHSSRLADGRMFQWLWFVLIVTRD